MKLTKILLPLDFSEQGDGAAQQAAALARHFGARLILYRQADLGGIEVKRIVVTGDPAASIVEFGHSEKPDLIVMPTHGRRGAGVGARLRV